VLVVVGVWTGGERFASLDNTLTILRFASVVGVVSIGMTFVIIGGGIDLSVGAILRLASIWATTVATQTLAADTHWLVMVGTALLVGASCGLVNGLLIAYGRLAPVHRDARHARRAPRPRRDHRAAPHPARSASAASSTSSAAACSGSPGWSSSSRSSPSPAGSCSTARLRPAHPRGRRQPEAARLAGIRVQRHIASLYVLLGTTCGIAAVMIVARTTTGSSTHGTLLELDAIAAVVIGGTLLSAVAARSSAPSSASSSSRRSRTSSR
jgi:ribose transport system permease protein